MTNQKTGRNDPCPCGSGKKYKQCCQSESVQLQGKQPTVSVQKLMHEALSHHQSGRFPQAESLYYQVLRLQPNQPDALALLGAIALHDLRVEDAIKFITRAIKINPSNPEYYSNLALALQFDGRIEEAIAHCRQAIRLKPDYVDAWYNLHSLLINPTDLQPSIECIQRVVQLSPLDMDARLLLGVMLDYAGQGEAAKVQFKHVEQSSGLFLARLDAWRYIRSFIDKGNSVEMIGSRINAFKIGMAASNPQGLIMELGVRNGNSIRKIAGMTRQAVHGFDSFEGLPEAWHHEPKGSYSTAGKIPTVPKNVMLHVGWFENTLPGFLEKYDEPVKFINIDCDIYSSTKTILDQLAPRMVAGSVILFDEYIGNEHWREDEYKAFQEAVEKYGWVYEYLCFSIYTKQVVVRIKSVK